MKRPLHVLSLPLLLAALAAPTLASIAKPPSGAQFGLHPGGVVNVVLRNADGCTFDFSASAGTPGIVALSRIEGTGLKKATIGIEAIGVGSTMVTIMSFNGSCPPATHTYQVDVDPDWNQVVKDFDKRAKADFKQFKLSANVSFQDYSSRLLDLSLQYKDDQLDDVGLHDAFHDAAATLRLDWDVAAKLAYTDLLTFGTGQLAANAAQPGDAPPGLFAGGCGSFDWFQDEVCSSYAGFHDRFDKASKKGIKSFEKAGSPIYGQWNGLSPIVSGGPLYPLEASAISMPQPFTAPLTITTLPARNEKGDDGRLLVSGMGYGALSGQLEVSLRREVFGQPPQTVTQTPAITADEWRAAFDDLVEGTYTLSTGYAGDAGRTEVPVFIGRRQFSF